MDYIKSWTISDLNLTINVDDKIYLDGEKKTITNIMTASDQIGPYACYIYVDGEFLSLVLFVDFVKSGRIKTIEQVREETLNNLI